MPSRTDRKRYVRNATYHVFNRGNSKQLVFHEPWDYSQFITYIQRVLSDMLGIKILIGVCMPNHWHIVLTQEQPREIALFVQRVVQCYVHYYNGKYGKIGPLFQSRYQAARLVGKKRIEEAIEYVCLNPEKAGLKKWPYIFKSNKKHEIRFIKK